MKNEVILVVAVDIEAKAEEDFNLWYDRHVTDVLDCPGWLWGTRYRSTEGSPSYLAIYGMESEAAMLTPERQAIKTFGRFWSHVDSYWARIYRPIYHDPHGTAFLREEGGPVLSSEPTNSASHDRGDRGPMTENIISVVGVDVESRVEEEFNRWYDEKHVREVLDCPGWKWGTRYKSTKASPNYMAIYGMESEEAMWTPELQSIKGFAHLWSHLDSYWGRNYKKIYHEAR